MPRCLVLRMVPCCLPQPKMHSIIARRDCDMPYPGCRVVRSSMALLRVLPVLVTAWFCVTCGVTLMARRLATWSAVSYALSSPAVMRWPAALLLAFSMISEARRSAVPLACVTKLASLPRIHQRSRHQSRRATPRSLVHTDVSNHARPHADRGNPYNPASATPNPRQNPHSARGTAPAYIPRFRALALFGRRPQERVEGFVMPASKNLVWGLGSQAENSQHAIFSFNSISLFDLNAHFFAPTHSVQTLSRAGFVKVGRRSDISSCSRRCRPIRAHARARPLARCGRCGRVEGSSLVAHDHSCRNLVFGGAAM